MTVTSSSSQAENTHGTFLLSLTSLATGARGNRCAIRLYNNPKSQRRYSCPTPILRPVEHRTSFRKDFGPLRPLSQFSIYATHCAICSVFVIPLISVTRSSPSSRFTSTFCPVFFPKYCCDAATRIGKTRRRSLLDPELVTWVFHS